MSHEEISQAELDDVVDVLRRYLLALPDESSADSGALVPTGNLEAISHDPAEFRRYVKAGSVAPAVAARILLIRLAEYCSITGRLQRLTSTDSALRITVAVDIIQRRLALGASAASSLSAFAARLLIASLERAAQHSRTPQVSAAAG